MRVIHMIRMTHARRIQAETRRHTHTYTHMRTTCSSGTSDAFFDVCSCTPVFFRGFGVRVAAASPCSLPALSDAFIGIDAEAPCAVAVGPAPQPRARESHSAGVGARRAHGHSHDTRWCVRRDVCPRRFYACAWHVPAGDCGAFGGSGGASPALAFLLLLVLLSLRPCFLSCSSDVLRDAHVHGCVGMQ